MTRARDTKPRSSLEGGNATARGICYGGEMDDAQRQLDSFIDKFTAGVAALTRALLEKMKARLPGAQILVYDNYKALASGLRRSDTAGPAIISLTVVPRG